MKVILLLKSTSNTGKTMVSLIAFGIEMTNSEKKCDCAFLDAQRVYDSFESILSEEFMAYKSACIKNATKQMVLSLLETISNAMDEDDTLVVYFSGHGERKNDKLFLEFVDSSVPIQSIADSFVEKKGKIVIILDCCYSGVATGIANKSSLGEINKISILASCDFYQTSHHDNLKSDFTCFFTKAISSLRNQNEEITLNSICKKIHSLGYNDCKINLQEGSVDIPLFKKSHSVKSQKTITSNVVRKLLNAKPEQREMIWYSLQSLPPSITKEVVDKLILQDSFFEPSWIVRRAIGSVLSDMGKDGVLNSYFIEHFIDSPNWMNICIGLIALRYHADNKEVQGKMIKILGNKDLPMDTIWLANLYYADLNKSCFQYGMGTKLSKTSWGVLELWKSYEESEELIAQEIRKLNIAAEIEESFVLNLYLRHLISPNKTLEKWKTTEYVILNTEKYEELARSKLTKSLYSLDTRGRLPANSKQKYILSAINGNWRYSFSEGFAAYFDETDKSTINKELELAKLLPLVEMKMEVFNYFVINEESFNKYHEKLLWGLSDPHPWVRRSAVKAFRNKPDMLVSAIPKNIDKSIYPGYIDLLLELIKCKVEVNICSLNLTNIERKTLKREKGIL